MGADGDLRRRLGRLGSKRADVETAGGSTPAERRRLPDGIEMETPLGLAYCIETVFPLDHLHGRSTLEELLQFETSLVAEVVDQPALGELSFRQLGFVDTETTGLAGGAGTLVFLVGIGVFSKAGFRLRQYFLRDPAEEAGMLHALAEDLESIGGFVTFNGRSFDLPLLEMRYVMGLRKRWDLTRWPHFDLLFPSRRLWRRELPDCRLGTLERRVLSVQRTEQDVPGAEIPGMYLDYLRTGDATEMTRVVYHNAIDILSLVGLTEQVLRRHGGVEASQLSASEAIALGDWHVRAGRKVPAKAAYREAAQSQDEQVRLEALRRYTAHLKREKDYAAALEGWQIWSELAPDDPRPCIELAKTFEWRIKDLPEALTWAQSGLVSLTHWPSGWQRDAAWAEIEHRISRLTRKLEAASE